MAETKTTSSSSLEDVLNIVRSEISVYNFVT